MLQTVFKYAMRDEKGKKYLLLHQKKESRQLTGNSLRTVHCDRAVYDINNVIKFRSYYNMT